MLLNEHVAVSTSKVLLVPYSVHHVPTYHEWMKSPDLQTATASEPLSLEEEYTMQQNWRRDGDKLTFIVCLADLSSNFQRDGHLDIRDMIGDVNMFICLTEDEDSGLAVVGELELMIASDSEQRKGYGRSAILSLLRYILENQTLILEEFQRWKGLSLRSICFSYFAVKIGQDNSRSIALFEKLGFVKTTSTPNYFDEFELRLDDLTLDRVQNLMLLHDVHDYTELEYKYDQ